MTQSHANISIFVPHIGCPNMCSFCDQRCITGVTVAPGGKDVINAVQTATKSKNYNPNNTEIAFFGGSFTAINRNYMLSLLSTAYEFVKSGAVSGIRISTRPDAIDGEILTLLKNYGVTSIELGAQSMDDEVLLKNNRGHTAEDVINSSKLISEYGFSLGLQMMTGLYGDTNDKAVMTAKSIIDLKPDTVRIYPTIVLKGTTLAALYSDGHYKPQTLGEAINLCSEILPLFWEVNIKVIRLGLHSIDEKSFVAGPWHPAFSEMCYSEIFLKRVLKILDSKGDYLIFVSPENISKMIGQKRSNIIKLRDMGYNCKVLSDKSLCSDEIYIKKGER